MTTTGLLSPKYMFMFTLFLVIFTSLGYLSTFSSNVFIWNPDRTSMTSSLEFSDKTAMNISKDANGDFKVSEVKKMLVKLSSNILKTLVHIRGTKARRYAVKSLNIVTKILNITKTSTDGLKRNTYESKNVCKEVYKGAQFGHPMYYTGFVRENCTYATPIESLVTILILERAGNPSNTISLLKDMSNYKSQINVIVATSDSTKLSSKYKSKNVQYLQIPENYTVGKAWNFIIGHVKSEFVLISRNVTRFNANIRLDRLLYEIESLGVTVAGGSSRDEDGLWKHGCYQTAYKNYTLVYEGGYDESMHECIFCDYLSSPFMTRTKTVQDYKFDEELSTTSVYHDFFLRLFLSEKESVVCPDSMFYVRRQELPDSLTHWKDFTMKYDIYQLRFDESIDIIMNCDDITVECNKKQGYAVHPCCLQDLANMVKFAMQLCEDSGCICEIFSGSLIGAVKFNNVLPWEKDGDIMFLKSNFTALRHYLNDHRQTYRLSIFRKYLVLHSRYWFVELFQSNELDSYKNIVNGIQPTKVLFDGQWVLSPENPGLWTRNRYGREIYAHAQHWRDFGLKSSWLEYRSNYFAPCKTPGSHHCLDNFNADGNLQFRKPIP